MKAKKKPKAKKRMLVKGVWTLIQPNGRVKMHGTLLNRINHKSIRVAIFRVSKQLRRPAKK